LYSIYHFETHALLRAVYRLMATELLRTRLEAITAARQSNPAISDPTPTLLDIEKTHILFTNAHFKPFNSGGW
jgi:hypothetical protein